MWIVLIIVGGLLGSAVGASGSALLGLIFGATLGYVLWRQNEADSRLADQGRELRVMKRIVDLLQADLPPPPPQRPAAARAADQAVTRAAEPRRAEEDLPPPARSLTPTRAEEDLPPPSPRTTAATTELTPPPLERWFTQAREWLTTGNIPVKVGVLVSFFGVAFLLRYAVEKQLFSVPIEVRYLAVAAGGVALFVLGLRLRRQNRVYALSLIGGAIGILYLTIFAAFRLHPLLPPAVAFPLLVVLSATIGILADRENAIALALLGIVGGFLAPVLVSTGSGNHVALFSYYLVLNGAILYISLRRSWRLLNLVGFVFTFGIGALWGAEYYRPQHFASTEPFLVAFFLLYHVVSILFARRQAPDLRGVVDGALVFGMPVVVFALQTQLVDGDQMRLALSAAALAGIYALSAAIIWREWHGPLRLLIESFIALAVAFATLAVPLALDDRWTAAAWAMEGAALVWIGVRQQRFLSKSAGTVLLLVAGVAFLRAGWSWGNGIAVLNGNFIGAALIALLAIHSARRLAVDTNTHDVQKGAAVVLLLWGVGWWLGAGGMEIVDRSTGDDAAHSLTLFLAASAALLTISASHFNWTAARRVTYAYLPLLLPGAVLALLEAGHVLHGAGATAWLVALAVHLFVLRRHETNGNRAVLALWHYLGGLFVAAVVASDLLYRLDDAGASWTWETAGVLSVLLLMAAGLNRARRQTVWPFAEHGNSYLAVVVTLNALVLLLLTAAGVDHPGDPAPLPYLPVLNPYDLLSALGLIVAVWWMRDLQRRDALLTAEESTPLVWSWVAAAIALSTIAVVRGVFHYTDLVWAPRELLQSVAVQAALSIFWASLGLAAMIAGARRGHRVTWIAGTAVMALVVGKLFLVDLGNTGTLARIVSFLGVGAMLLVVGYFAPAPPRGDASDESAG